MSRPGYLNFLVSDEDLALLKQLADEKGYGRSEFARKCLRAGLRLAPDFEPKATDHAVHAAKRRRAAVAVGA